MTRWFVRNRGRVSGPYTAGEMHELIKRRCIQEYQEVSEDGNVWVPVRLVPALASHWTNASIEALPEVIPATVMSHRQAPRGNQGRSDAHFWWIVGSVVAATILLMAGVIVLIVLYHNANSQDPAIIARKAQQPNQVEEKIGEEARNERPAAPEAKRADRDHGPIIIGKNTAPEIRDSMFREAVGLVAAGAKIRGVTGQNVEFPQGFGSGFVVHPAGFIMTNRHVIEGCLKEMAEMSMDPTYLKRMREYGIDSMEPKVWVFINRTKYEALIKYVSDRQDFAILKINRTCRRWFRLSDCPPNEVPLIAVSSLGFPGTDWEKLGLESFLKKGRERELRGDRSILSVEDALSDEAFEFSKRDGSLVKRAFRRKMMLNADETVVFQHTAQIFPGNSGGPMIAEDGTVLGINTWIKGKLNTQNLNYAIAVQQLRSEIDSHVSGVEWVPGIP